jgi:hypothetical protein
MGNAAKVYKEVCSDIVNRSIAAQKLKEAEVTHHRPGIKECRMKDLVEVVVIECGSGHACLSINARHVAGSKPWGSTLYKWMASVSEILAALKIPVSGCERTTSTLSTAELDVVYKWVVDHKYNHRISDVAIKDLSERLKAIKRQITPVCSCNPLRAGSELWWNQGAKFCGDCGGRKPA